MSRVEEVKETIRKIDEDIFCLPSLTDRILMDISVSLAVIADSMSRPEEDMPCVHIDPELLKETAKE